MFNKNIQGFKFLTKLRFARIITLISLILLLFIASIKIVNQEDYSNTVLNIINYFSTALFVFVFLIFCLCEAKVINLSYLEKDSTLQDLLLKNNVELTPGKKKSTKVFSVIIAFSFAISLLVSIVYITKIEGFEYLQILLFLIWNAILIWKINYFFWDISSFLKYAFLRYVVVILGDFIYLMYLKFKFDYVKVSFATDAYGIFDFIVELALNFYIFTSLSFRFSQKAEERKSELDEFIRKIITIQSSKNENATKLSNKETTQVQTSKMLIDLKSSNIIRNLSNTRSNVKFYSVFLINGITLVSFIMIEYLNWYFALTSPGWQLGSLIYYAIKFIGFIPVTFVVLLHSLSNLKTNKKYYDNLLKKVEADDKSMKKE